MKLKCLLSAILLTVLLSGCAYFKQHETFEKSGKLRVGMTREEVRAIMGDPLDVPYAQHDIWFYYIRTEWHDGQYTIDECLPVVFKNDKVAGWGKNYVNQQRLIKRPYERPKIEGLK